MPPARCSVAPFKAHCAQANNGVLGILAAHGFYVLSTSDGTMLNEGRSTPGGFTEILARPGGGWILSGRQGHLHFPAKVTSQSHRRREGELAR